jgi:hypothetical protein
MPEPLSPVKKQIRFRLEGEHNGYERSKIKDKIILDA